VAFSDHNHAAVSQLLDVTSQVQVERPALDELPHADSLHIARQQHGNPFLAILRIIHDIIPWSFMVSC
jgi:hypothetical protein